MKKKVLINKEAFERAFKNCQDITLLYWFKNLYKEMDRLDPEDLYYDYFMSLADRLIGATARLQNNTQTRIMLQYIKSDEDKERFVWTVYDILNEICANGVCDSYTKAVVNN